MYLTARAEVLADLSELAQACVQCFSRARCAGCDTKAITPVAKAAVVLGAELRQLAVNAPPHGSDSEYLDEVASLRVAIRQRIRECEDLANKAVDQSEAAQRAMEAALKARPPDYAAYSAALAMHQDAECAWNMCVEARGTLIRADRLLATAGAALGGTYEVPGQFVARGGLLPYEGRWLSGEGSPSIGGSPPTMSERASR